MRMAILGPGNTFSDVACDAYMGATGQQFVKRHYDTIEQVVEAVGPEEFGILPFENTLDGYMQRHMDLLFEHRLAIEAELRVPVAFDLVSRTPLERVGRIYVHPVAQNQCLRFFRTIPPRAIVATESNGMTFERYRADPDAAAVLPRHLADAVADSPFRIPVTDEESNHTRFLIVRQGEANLSAASTGVPLKVSLLVEPKEDRPGLLFAILRVFANRQVNLISIMSRPTRRRIGTYRFFLELEADESRLPSIRDTLAELQGQHPIRTLGIYRDVGQGI